MVFATLLNEKVVTRNPLRMEPIIVRKRHSMGFSRVIFKAFNYSSRKSELFFILELSSPLKLILKNLKM